MKKIGVLFGGLKAEAGAEPGAEPAAGVEEVIAE